MALSRKIGQAFGVQRYCVSKERRRSQARKSFIGSRIQPFDQVTITFPSHPGPIHLYRRFSLQGIESIVTRDALLSRHASNLSGIRVLPLELLLRQTPWIILTANIARERSIVAIRTLKASFRQVLALGQSPIHKLAVNIGWSCASTARPSQSCVT